MKTIYCVALAALLLGWTSATWADFITGDITVTATNSSGTASQSFSLDPSGCVTLPDGSSQWDCVSTPVSSGAGMGTIKNLVLDADADPAVRLNFAVSADPNFDTTFTLTSGTMTFGAITNPIAFASAGVTLTDNSDFGTGAVLTGSYSGEAYQGLYNSTNNVFATLVPGPVSVYGGTTTVNDRSPASGTTIIPGDVSSISSQFAFTVSANNSASGTSNFVLTPAAIPEPSTLALLGIAALGLIGYRWRKR